jgi:hypothetical protein
VVVESENEDLEEAALRVEELVVVEVERLLRSVYSLIS